MASIFILGMHRSGTSLVAGILKTLGVHLGPDSRLMGPGEDNPKGYFEHAELVRINNAILERLGGSWDRPPYFPPGWLSRVSDLRETALGIMRRDLFDSPLWAVKDPRMCLSFPFWKALSPGPEKCVIVVRNPLETAESLLRRNALPLRTSHALWLAYVRASILATRGLPRHIVFFKRLVEVPRREIELLARFAGPSGWEARIGEAEAFFESGLQHHRIRRRDMLKDASLMPEAKKAYLALDLFSELAKRRAPSEDDILELDEFFAGLS